MNSTQPQGQIPQGQPQQSQQARVPFFRPEQMRSLPGNFTADEKEKWENGLNNLYRQMNESAPDSQAHQTAKKKIFDFSATLHKKVQQVRPQAGQPQPRPANPTQPQQVPADGSQNASQAPKLPQPQPPSPALLQHLNSFPYALPPNLVPNSADAAKWLQETKNKYGKGLVQMENIRANLNRIDIPLKEMKDKMDQGQQVNQDEYKSLVEKKENYQKSFADAKRWIDNFRKQYGEPNAVASTGAQPTSQPQPQVGIAVPPRPTLNIQQQAPNQLLQNQAMQNTEAIQAAMQAGRMQQAGRPSMPQNDQMSQPPNGQPMNATSLPNVPQPSQGVNVKVEGGTSQLQVNTAIAVPPHAQANVSRQPQSTPQSANPQSATTIGPPKPLTHATALSHAARAYSSSQTSSTPNVMASHAHPSVPRESPNINSAKMPIPKLLPPNITGPPIQVPMQPARPTYSGGPSNSGAGVMSQPVLQKTPGYNIEGEGDRVMNKRKLDELVRQVTGGGEGSDSCGGLTPEVEDAVLMVADEFVDQVISAACKCAKARGSKTLEIRDIQLILERNYNIRIPGYASDEIRTVRKFQPAQGWIAKMSAIQAAKVTGGKGDL